MTTGLIESWAANPAEMGPLYPFVSFEAFFFAICFVLWMLYTLWQMRFESGKLPERKTRICLKPTTCSKRLNPTAHTEPEREFRTGHAVSRDHRKGNGTTRAGIPLLVTVELSNFYLASHFGILYGNPAQGDILFQDRRAGGAGDDTHLLAPHGDAIHRGLRARFLPTPAPPVSAEDRPCAHSRLLCR